MKPQLANAQQKRGHSEVQSFHEDAAPTSTIAILGWNRKRSKSAKTAPKLVKSGAEQSTIGAGRDAGERGCAAEADYLTATVLAASASCAAPSERGCGRRSEDGELPALGRCQARFPVWPGPPGARFVTPRLPHGTHMPL